MERMRFSVGQKSKKDETKLELAKTFFDKEFAKANKQHADILLSSDMLKGMEEFGKIFHQQKCEDKK